VTAGAITLATVVEAICGERPAGWDRPVTSTVVDSREAEDGALFVALQGEEGDGHDYVGDAVSRGAIAAIVERELAIEGTVLDATAASVRWPESWSLPLMIKTSSSLRALQRAAALWRSRHDVRTIGITGSIGKTTTKELVASVLKRRYVTLKSQASHNNEVGLPLALMALTDAHERAVLEMGMYDVGEIAELARIARPHVGVVTVVGPVHLSRARTIERIAAGKRELVEALPPAPDGVAILNYDDERVRAMAAFTSARVLYYGLSSAADLWADEIEGLGLDGTRFQLHHGEDALHVKVPLLGRHSVQTALRAAAVGLVEGLTWQEIIEGLRAPSAQLRLVAVPGPSGSTLLDDTYNASPTSAIAALNLLDELDGRKIAVLGDMRELGDLEQEGHEKVGMRALEVADILVTVGLLGRLIGETALRWGMAPDAVWMVDTNEEAVALLKGMVAATDVILVKGSRVLEMEGIVDSLGGNRWDSH
jgi:UDP-N-acetylmuramoyl-tripeptide--D-alanyl-D-alanine ligase